MQNNATFSYTPLFWDQTFKCYQSGHTGLLKATCITQRMSCEGAEDTYIEPHINPHGSEQQSVYWSLLLKQDFGFSTSPLQDDQTLLRACILYSWVRLTSAKTESLHTDLALASLFHFSGWKRARSSWSSCTKETYHRLLTAGDYCPLKPANPLQP